jgi:hypothetical protein
VKQLILIAVVSTVTACSEAPEAAPPALATARAAVTTLILECGVKLIAFEGKEITRRRTYKIDVVAKSLRYWQEHTGVWAHGGNESRLTFETPSELTFETSSMLGDLQETRMISFDRAIGAVEGSLRLSNEKRTRPPALPVHAKPSTRLGEQCFLMSAGRRPKSSRPADLRRPS